MRNNPFSHYSHAIVTGGSSGIGKEVAKTLAGYGVNVTIMARRRDVLEQAAEEIVAQGGPRRGDVLALSVDVSDKVAIDAAVAEAIARFGPAGILVTSAGIAYPGYFDAQSDEIFETTMRINFYGSLYALRAVLPSMRVQKCGHVAFVSSGAGLVGLYGYTSYSPSKFALRGLAESLRGELKEDGIKISIAYPPDTDTPQLHEENKTKPAETKLMTESAKTWIAADVAEVIVQGMARGKFALTPGFEMTWLNRLHSLFGPLLHWHFDRLAKKAKKR